MSKSDFELVRAAGLKLHRVCNQEWADMVYAADVQAWLERAPVYYGRNSAAQLFGYTKEGERYDFACRVVCEQPIQPPDTAESLLRELMANLDNGDKDIEDFRNWKSILDRARRLLARESEGR